MNPAIDSMECWVEPPARPPRWPRVVALLLLVGVAAMLIGCGSQSIEAPAIQGTVHDVVATHDAYVLKDESLTELEREVLLGNSEVLRKVVDEAAGQGSDQ